jgi:hypothetical protein
MYWGATGAERPRVESPCDEFDTNTFMEDTIKQ